MTEIRIRPISYIYFNLLPIAPVISDLLAKGTYRQYSPENPDFAQRMLKVLYGPVEVKQDRVRESEEQANSGQNQNGRKDNGYEGCADKWGSNFRQVNLGDNSKIEFGNRFVGRNDLLPSVVQSGDHP